MYTVKSNTADNRIPIAITNEKVNLEKTILGSNLGFSKIATLNHKHPSTSYSVRNKELKVELLTPEIGKPANKPIMIHSLNTPATPLRFMDYLLLDTQPAVIVIKSGVLINVPSPARYVLHKCVISQRRPPAMATKAKKDLMQANVLLEVLLKHRPGDVRQAWEAATAMPTKFQTQLQDGIGLLDQAIREKLQTFIK